MLNPLLRLRHLRCFLETARLGSLSAAAEALHISQPAASKTIRELEEILAVTLFDRSGRRLQLTAAGQVFQSHAGGVIADLERAQQAVLAPQRQRPRLSLGVLPTAATHLVPEAALALRETMPEALIEVMTGPNWLLLSLLREGQLDLVVGRMPPAGNSEGVKFVPLYWEKVVPVVRAGHPLTQRPWQPEDLRHFPLMLPPQGAMITGSVRAWLHSVGITEPEPAFENVSLAFGREVLRQSDTIWFISEGVVRPEVGAGSLAILPLRNELLGGPVGVSRRSDAGEGSGLEQAMLAALSEAAGKTAASLQ
ncbi:LysR substrate-binding domain-containing protein [Pseudogemmobacter faecipullorum]|uniref:LysR family transcriptional regulator n=1 Tax=Pseudogemmobacter faecipullorum TaxID=2755041 RepID=A0ABS8CRM3_9RHOB|nr:LysR substrate-binding domain-containing protein [Pseudogemmobacter faecipullorum]MCB5412036.1 LysR family transcriptional regulator [Pseudogemmobacter faecipullorum]